MCDTWVVSNELVELPAGDLTAVYHRRLGGLSLIDAQARKLLQKFSVPRELDPSLLKAAVDAPEDELLQQFMLRKFLVPASATHEALQPEERHQQEPHNRLTPQPRGKINIIQLIMANSCNFGCTYCFEGLQGSDARKLDAASDFAKISNSRVTAPSQVKVNRDQSIYASKERLAHQYDPKNRLMRPADAIAYVRNALDVCKSTGADEVMIQFFGGEPMLNWRAIKEVLTTFGRGEGSDIRINYSTVTNGSLITDEVAQMFALYQVGVCVSFDSPTSKSRPLKNGEDSTPTVTSGLRKLQQYRNYLAINVALTSDTWEEFDTSMVEFAARYGAREIGVVIDFDPTFYEKYSATQIVDKLFPIIQAGRQRGIVLTGYWHQIFQLLQGHDVVRQRGFKNCSAKGAQLSIEPNGSAFSCKAGSGLYGSILDSQQILSSTTYQQHDALRYENPSFCHGCEVEGFCAGICLGPLEKKFGVVDAVEPASCGVYRGITRKLIQALAPYEVPTFDLAEACGRSEPSSSEAATINERSPAL